MAGVRTEPVSSGKYRGWFIDQNGKQRYFTGTRNKKATLAKAKELEAQHRLARLKNESSMFHAEDSHTYSFAEIKDEYLAWGQTQGGRRHGPWGTTHARNRRMHLNWWQQALNLETLSNLEGMLPAVEKIRRNLQREGTSNKTLNNYTEALRAFCHWCIKRDYLSKDPLHHLERFDESAISLRRAMTEEEIHQLRKHAPYFRWLLYATALETGLRANELRSLTVRDLDVENNGLRLHKAWTKDRKDRFQPLSMELVEQLKEWVDTGEAKALYKKYYSRKTAKATISSTPLLYVPSHTARSLDLDLATAGIAKETEEGKIDFHALRTAFITLAIEAPGVNIKEVQTLARHSTPQITLNHYARTRPERLTKVVSNIGSRIRGDDT